MNRLKFAHKIYLLVYNIMPLFYKIYYKQDPSKIFIGYTTHNDLEKTKSYNNSVLNNEKRNKTKLYQFINEVGIENMEYEIIEPIDSYYDPVIIKQRHAELHDKYRATLNNHYPYYESVKERKKAFNNKHKNDDKYKPLTCEVCGRIYTQPHEARHKRTQFHQNALNNTEELSELDNTDTEII
jgi:uncharacterized protein YutD